MTLPRLSLRTNGHSSARARPWRLRRPMPPPVPNRPWRPPNPADRRGLVRRTDPSSRRPRDGFAPRPSRTALALRSRPSGRRSLRHHHAELILRFRGICFRRLDQQGARLGRNPMARRHWRSGRPIRRARCCGPAARQQVPRLVEVLGDARSAHSKVAEFDHGCRAALVRRLAIRSDGSRPPLSGGIGVAKLEQPPARRPGRLPANLIAVAMSVGAIVTMPLTSGGLSGSVGSAAIRSHKSKSADRACAGEQSEPIIARTGQRRARRRLQLGRPRGHDLDIAHADLRTGERPPASAGPGRTARPSHHRR